MIPIKKEKSIFNDILRICPIFTISCVTGENLNLLKKFLNVLPPLLNNTERDKLSQELAEFRVDEIYTNQSVGNIISGMLVKYVLINSSIGI